MIKKAKLTVIVEDTLKKGDNDRGLKAEHGLSVLLEIPESKLALLVDTGQSPKTLSQNMEILGVDPKNVNAIFLTHSHYDHTGGLPAVLKQLNIYVPVVAHPEIFRPTFKFNPYIQYIGSPFSESEVRLWGGLPVLSRNSAKITNEVFTTGEIDRCTSFEKTQGFWTVKKDMFMKDPMRDDQALILNFENKGFVVISGCAHAGIINTVIQAGRIMGNKKIYAVVGGFHLVGSARDRINSTVNNLTDLSPDLVCPCHCTGSKAIKEMVKVFGEKCKPLGTGDIIEL